MSPLEECRCLQQHHVPATNVFPRPVPNRPPIELSSGLSVELVDATASDTGAVKAARVSTAGVDATRDDRAEDQVCGLIRDLMRCRHGRTSRMRLRLSRRRQPRRRDENAPATGPLRAQPRLSLVGQPPDRHRPEGGDVASDRAPTTER
jgi:hypothetical protein